MQRLFVLEAAALEGGGSNLLDVKAGKWHRDVAVIVGGTSCESCAGQGMLVPPGAPHTGWQELPTATHDGLHAPPSQ